MVHQPTNNPNQYPNYGKITSDAKKKKKKIVTVQAHDILTSSTSKTNDSKLRILLKMRGSRCHPELSTSNSKRVRKGNVGKKSSISLAKTRAFNEEKKQYLKSNQREIELLVNVSF